jgi:hypothetical protein
MCADLQNAIHNSILRTSIITVTVSDMAKAYEELVTDIGVAAHDYVDVSDTLREVWGTDILGNAWRVHLQQLDRTNPRYQE